MAEPKVRFKRDDGSSYPEWTTIPMSEVFTEVSEKNHPDMPVLSVQQGVGTVLRDSSDRNILYDKSNLKNYKAMKKDDFIIHLRSFEGGLECSNYDGISSPAYRILRPQAILPAAYRDYFRSYEFIHNKLAVSVVGIRDGKNIDMETFWQIPMTIPCPEEQQKIADFLASVDEVISTSEQEVANLETQKKAVMKKIFSQEVRFTKADGTEFPEWEEKKLGDVGRVLMCKRVLKEQTTDNGDVPFFKIGTFGGTPDAYISRELFEELKRKYSYPKIGNILLSAAGTIGRAVVFEGEEAYYQDSNIVWLDHDDSLSDKFLYHFYDMTSWDNLEGGTVKRLYNGILLDKDIGIPHPDEQRLIAEFLSDFDEAIAAAKRELELWKVLKKGLLQQMFV